MGDKLAMGERGECHELYRIQHCGQGYAQSGELVSYFIRGTVCYGDIHKLPSIFLSVVVRGEVTSNLDHRVALFALLPLSLVDFLDSVLHSN